MVEEKNMRALWIAADGKQFVVEGNTLKDVQEKISELRKEHNYEEPDFSTIEVNDPAIDVSGITHLDDISDTKLREQLKETIKKGMPRPISKTLN